MDKKTLRRFNAKINRLTDPGCWLWIMSTNTNGYGVFGLKESTSLAHRFAYELWRGPIPDGLHVLHECDVPNCVNPDHLFLGTQQDNMADMNAKGRGCHGARHPMACLRDSDIVEIRSHYASGELSQDHIGNMYGVARRTVNDIVNRKTWKHIA